jgi:hypothetical protein
MDLVNKKNITKIISSIILVILIQGCSQEKKKKLNKEEKTNQILKEQLEKGVYNYIYDSESLVNNYSMKDMESNLEITRNLLKVSGFKIISKEDFNGRIKKIFGRTLKPDSSKKYLYVSYSNKCDRFLEIHPNNVDYDGTYIIKEGNFITDFYRIPELIDYQKEYPSLFQYEKKLPSKQTSKDYGEIGISFWKDQEGLPEQRKKNIQTLVNRNKYLFNDNKASLVWLKFNDEYFLESLVKVFGYVQDKDLLKWVLDRSLYDDEFDKILITKNCDNKYVFNKEVFEVIAQSDAKNKEKYFNFLREHFPKIDGLSFSEDTKIKALYCYYSTNLDKNNNESSFYSFFPKLNEKKYEDEFRKNNYYNIPDFKKLFEDTKNGGIGLPM